MIGVDTNVLIRFFVEDDPKQAQAAKNFLIKAKQRRTPILINLVVLCEMVWVLESGYGYSRGEVAALLQKILSTKQFEIQNKNLVWRAIDDYRIGPFDFADCLIGQINHDEGAIETVTFDRALRRLAHFRQL